MFSVALATARVRPVFPLGEHGKKPRIAKKDGGRGLLDATQDERQIREWGELKYPLPNIGSPVLERELWLDFDPRNGSDETHATLVAEHGIDWTKTRAHKTR